MKKIILIFSIWFSSNSYAQIRVKVNEGIRLKDTQLQQVVVLSSEKGGVCTGELIGPKVVLTAAHCCDGGVVHAKKFSSTVRYQIHPDYRKTTSPYFGFALPDIYVLEHDVCVIELEAAVQKVTPFSLPTTPAEVGTEHIIVGAGDPHVGERQFGYMSVVKANEKGIQAQGTLNYGRPGDSGGALLEINLEKTVTLKGVSSVSTYFCGEQGVIFTADNKYRCANMTSQIQSEIFVPAHTTGFASLVNAGNVSFIKTYADQNHVDICGLNLQCGSVQFER